MGGLKQNRAAWLCALIVVAGLVASPLAAAADARDAKKGASAQKTPPKKITPVEQVKRETKVKEAAKIDKKLAADLGKKTLPETAKANPKLVKPKPEDIARPPTLKPRTGVQYLNPESFLVQTKRNYISVIRFGLKKENSKEDTAMFARLEKKFTGRAFFGEIILKYEALFAECTPYIYAGLPAVVIFRNGVRQEELRGAPAVNEKSVDQLIQSHVETFTAPLFRPIDDVEELKKFTSKYEGRRPMAFVYVDPAKKESPLATSFKFAAISLHDRLGLSTVCAELRSPKLLPFVFKGNASSLKSPIMMSVATSEGQKLLNFAPGYEDPIELEKFMFLNSIPALWPLVSETGMYFTGGKPVFAIFTSANSRFEVEMMKTFAKVAKKFEDAFHFVTADLQSAKYFSNLPKRDRKKLESGFAISSTGHLGTGMKRYVFGGEKTEEGLGEWTRMFLAGELEKKKTVSSSSGTTGAGLVQRGSVTDPQTGQSKVLVREIAEDEWNAHVLDGERDVMVVQYASRCAACHSFAPILEEVAVALSHVGSLEFVTINLDNENVPEPFRASRIPYVLLFPANRKNRPVSFRMRRMKRHSLIRFIKRNAAIRFTARNRDVEVFYARTLTFGLFWLFMTGVFLKKTKRAHLFVSRVEERFAEFDKKF